MKDKVKNKNRKLIVEIYQQGVQRAIDEIKSRDGKLDQSTKNYLLVLEANISRAPYLLGYLEWPTDKTKKEK
jgi:hypothetical protein